MKSGAIITGDVVDSTKGFLLAGKSVFRFGELNRAQDIKVTEYVLIGTFVSFTIAIVIGFGVKSVNVNIRLKMLGSGTVSRM